MSSGVSLAVSVSAESGQEKKKKKKEVVKEKEVLLRLEVSSRVHLNIFLTLNYMNKRVHFKTMGLEAPPGG